jgi:hypothetical protein
MFNSLKQRGKLFFHEAVYLLHGTVDSFYTGNKNDIPAVLDGQTGLEKPKCFPDKTPRAVSFTRFTYLFACCYANSVESVSVFGKISNQDRANNAVFLIQSSEIAVSVE